MSIPNTNNEKILKELAVTFFKGCLLQLDESVKLSTADQKQLLDYTINHPKAKKYPQHKTQSKLFLKQLIEYLEVSSEVSDEIYEALCSLMKDSDLKNEFCYRHYILDDDLLKIVTIKESTSLIVSGTTGLRTWEAGQMLADWALSSKLIFKDKNVLELGSGVGFAGITIARFCDIASICFTDCHDDVLEILQENININFPKHSIGLRDEIDPHISVLKLDWETFATLPSEVTADIVIGADIVYDPAILNSLCTVFQKLFDINNNLIIYIASTVRNNETIRNFDEYLG